MRLSNPNRIMARILNVIFTVIMITMTSYSIYLRGTATSSDLIQGFVIAVLFSNLYSVFKKIFLRSRLYSGLMGRIHFHGE